MTTPAAPRRDALRLHLAVAGAALVPGLVAVGLAALVHGSDAAVAALTGALLLVGVVLFGSVAVDVVAGLSPQASLPVALLTYGLQLVLVLGALVALSRSAEYAPELMRRWLFAGLASTLLGWVVGQVVAAVRVRVPLYDVALPGDAEKVASDTCNTAVHQRGHAGGEA